MRIIAGQFRSRILKPLKGQSLRPTSDYLRETLFNVLGPNVAGARFLDLFAGTGAVGIEAISRGAIEVLFVEKHPSAVKLIRENLALLKIESGVQIIPADAAQAVEKLASRKRPPFDFIFLDPPYAEAREYEQTLRILGDSNLIAANAIVIAEHRKTFELLETFGVLRRYRVLKQGDASLSFYRVNSSQE